MKDRLSRPRAYVAKLPPGISGSNGHGATFYAACILVQGFALDEEDALCLLREYNARCAPPWTERELLHKIKDAARKADPSRPRGYLLAQGEQAAARFIESRRPTNAASYRSSRSSVSDHPAVPAQGVEVIWKLERKVPALETGKQAVTPVTGVSRSLPPTGLKLTPADWGMLAAAGMDRDPLILTALRIFDAYPVAVNNARAQPGKE